MEENSSDLSGERDRSRRGRARDPEVDEAILSAAMDLLAEIGYARLTMDQIAARARVGKASVYLRWPNKVALVAEAIQQSAAVIPDVPDTGSLPEDVRAFLRALLRSKSKAQRAVAAVAGEIASNPELAKAWRQGVAGTLFACVRVMVDRAIVRGELPADSDVDLLTMLPVTLLQSWRQAHEQSPDDTVVERIVNQFFTPAPWRSARITTSSS
jgi:AcrR family transcriptional regulator